MATKDTFQSIINRDEFVTGDISNEGERLAGLGFVPVASKIESADLAESSPVNYQSPEPTTIPDVSGIPSETTQPELSKPQSDLQNMINELTSTNLTLEGQKQAFRTEQEKKAGLEEQLKAENDLSSQLKQLQTEASNIPNQLQLSAEGRGITAGGLAPIQTARLRENSIKANTVGALLAATQGKIAFSNSLIDRAVQAEFGPKEARQKALLANLDIIIKSPEYTEDEKRRALAQKKIQDAETAKIEQDKADRKAILDTATEAAKNGADSLTLQKISQAKTPIDAIQIASEAGVLSANQKEVANLQKKYPDASISLTDSLADATAKLSNSKLYQKETSKETTKTVKVGSGKTSKTYQITYDAMGKEIKRELMGAGDDYAKSVGAESDTLNYPGKELNPTPVDKATEQRIIQQLVAQKGITKQQRSDLINLVKSQGIEGVKAWAYNNMLAVGEKDTFDTYSNAAAAFNQALDEANANNLEVGPYKALAEDKKPWLSIQRDSKYGQLFGLIEMGQAQLRKGFFGTAVTGTEAGNAKKFLITDNDDMATILWKLEQGSNFLKFVNDSKLNRSVGLDKPKLSDYLTATKKNIKKTPVITPESPTSDKVSAFISNIEEKPSVITLVKNKVTSWLSNLLK